VLRVLATHLGDVDDAQGERCGGLDARDGRSAGKVGDGVEYLQHEERAIERRACVLASRHAGVVGILLVAVLPLVARTSIGVTDGRDCSFSLSELSDVRI
jgi:hypothetical protein